MDSFNPTEDTANPQIVFSWKAPLRAYKKKSGRLLRFYIALAILLSIIIFFFQDIVLLVPIWALLFLFYVLTITPPPDVENKITTFGVETAGLAIRWEVLGTFYFIKRFGFDILVVVSHGPYFAHSYMVVPTEDVKQKVIQLLSQHLVYQEKPQRTVTDQLIDWFSHLVPDDEDHEEVTPPTAASSFPQTPSQASL